jgi:hypothetical protein
MGANYYGKQQVFMNLTVADSEYKLPNTYIGNHNWVSTASEGVLSEDVF